MIRFRRNHAGFGEALRLHATGGAGFFGQFEANIDDALNGNSDAMQTIISGALSVKRAVVEEDEFEKSLRRSMNYGHSVGHAIESLTNFAFPHGMAIAIGVMAENMIATASYGLNDKDASRINKQAIKLIDDDAKQALRFMDLKNVNEVLRKDKKTLGNTLKMAIPVKLGNLTFQNFNLDHQTNTSFLSAFSAAELI